MDPNPDQYRPSPAPQPLLAPAQPINQQSANVPSSPAFGIVPEQPLLYNQAATMPPQKQRKVLMPLFFGAATLLVLGTVAAVFIAAFTQPSPDKTLRTALQNSLATHSFSQTTTEASSKASIDFDVSDIKNPKVASTVSLGESDLSGSFQGYGDHQDTFVKITGGNSTKLNTWIQVRRNGTLPASSEAAFDGLYDPRIQFYGDIILGNFSPSQRQSLVAYIMAQHIYSYNAAKVTSDTVDGHAVFVYHVTISAAKLKALNQKVATMTDLDATSLQTVLSNIGDSTVQATLYISKHNPHLLKAVNSSNMVTLYSNFDSTTVGAKPTTSLQWADYYTQTNDSVVGQLSQLQASTKDIERQTDIRSLQSHLEAYYAQNGYYPTFAQMNDSTWISTNLPGIDPSIFKDPDSSGTGLAAAPTKNQYSYQGGADTTYSGCDNAQKKCMVYKVAATLSDGSLFSLASLN